MFEELEDLHSYRWNGHDFVLCNMEYDNGYTWLKKRGLMMKNERFSFDFDRRT